MNNFSKLTLVMLATGMLPGSAMAKDLYLSADGNDSNSGLSASAAKKTLTSLTNIIAAGDVVHISGLLNMADEIPANIDSQAALAGSDLNDNAGKWVKHDDGKKRGFNLSGAGASVWKGISFVGEDPNTDGFTGDQKNPFFIIRGKDEGGMKFENLGFYDGICNQDGGTIFIKDDARVDFTNCLFVGNHPDWSKFALEENAWKAQDGASERGGAITIQSNSVVNFKRCSFENNINRFGGAVMINGTAQGVVNTGGVTFYDCNFLNNSAYGCVDENPDNYLDNSNGGAITVWTLNGDAYVTIDHCVFDGNKTNNNGGAVYLYSNTKYGHYADVIISNSAFYNNYSGRGGALEITNYTDGPMEAKDYITRTMKTKIINTTFGYNSCKDDGGAILLWGCTTDPTRPDHPQDELMLVNCTLVGNTTTGNAGHGAGYKEMSRTAGSDGGTDAYAQLDNGRRYFYNCLFENNYATGVEEGPEISDFCSGSISNLFMDSNYIGRIVATGGLSVEDFVASLNDAEGSETVVNGYSGDMVGENVFHLASSDIAPFIYEMSGYMVPFMPLPDDAEVIGMGNVKWLTLDDQDLPVPGYENEKISTNRGYDISAADQLGFKRPEGTCTIGASEALVSMMEEYLEGAELPFRDGEIDGVAAVADKAGLNVSFDGVAVVCPGASLNVYSLSGSKVAAGVDRLDLSALASGVYVVKAATAEGSVAVKIVK